MEALSKYIKEVNDADDKTACLLIKFTPEQYVNYLIQNGRFRFGSILEYTHSEQKEIGDPLEDTDTYIKNTPDLACNLTNTTTKEEFDLTDGLISIKIRNNDGYNHIISFYSISTPNRHAKFDSITNQKFIDKRCEEFGNKCIIIWNLQEFKNRVTQAIKKHNLILDGKPVPYLNPNQDVLHLGKFGKTNDYEHQQEYRMRLKNIQPLDKPFFLDIGNIEDITKVYDTQDILENHSLNINIENRTIDIMLGKEHLQFQFTGFTLLDTL